MAHSYLKIFKISDLGKKSQLSLDPTNPHEIYLNMYCFDAMVLLTLSQGNPLAEGDMFKRIKTPFL